MITKKTKDSLIAFIIVSIYLTYIIFGITLIVNNRSKRNHRDNNSGYITDWSKTGIDEVISSNILLMGITAEAATEFSGTILRDGGRGSGVIIRNDGGKYYALTALHGRPIGEESIALKMIVFGYDQQVRYEEDGSHLVDYYYGTHGAAEATIEYYDWDYDLALISFYSEEEYTVLSIASEPPKYNDSVAVISNPLRERNTVGFGKIISKNPVPSSGPTIFDLIEHSAYTNFGSSGAALLNENLEIVGICQRASIAETGEFFYGMALPSDRILEFLSNADYY